VLNGCSLWHPLNYNKKLWQCKKHWNFPIFLIKFPRKKKSQPNSFSCWERDRMSVPKSKNPKIKNNNNKKMYNTNIYYSPPRRVCIPLFLHPVGVNRPWQDEWMTRQLNGWMMKQMDEMMFHNVLYYM
jgi:hypothetical protein